MKISPEARILSPDENEPIENSNEGSKPLVGLEKAYFLTTAIERKPLLDLSEAIERNDTEKAQGLITKDVLAVGHFIDQLRLKDMFPDDSEATFQEDRKQAEQVLSNVRDLRDEIRQKQESDEHITEEDLGQFLQAATMLFDHLEKLIPPNMQQEYINKELDKTEQALSSDDYPENKRVAIESKKQRLIEAKKRFMDNEHGKAAME